MQDDIHNEGHDPSFLLNSAFSKDSGLAPRAVYRNLAPAEIYEKVNLSLFAFPAVLLQ